MFDFLTKYVNCNVLIVLFSMFNCTNYMHRLIFYAIDNELEIFRESLLLALTLSCDDNKNNDITIMLLNNFSLIRQEDVFLNYNIYVSIIYCSIKNDNVELFKILVPSIKVYDKYKIFDNNVNHVITFNAVKILNYIIKLGENRFDHIFRLAVYYNNYFILKEMIIHFNSTWFFSNDDLFEVCYHEDRIDMMFLIYRNLKLNIKNTERFYRKLIELNHKEFIAKIPLEKIEPFTYGSSKKFIQQLQEEIILHKEQLQLQ